MSREIAKDFSISNTASIDTSALADIGEVVSLDGNKTLLGFEVKNADADAFADFALLVKAHPSAAYFSILTGADWATVTGILKSCVTTPRTLASGATTYCYVDIGPVHSVKFQCKAAANTITVGNAIVRGFLTRP